MATAVQRAQAVLGNIANADQSNIDLDTAKNIANAAWARYIGNSEFMPNGDPIPESPTWEQKAIVLLNTLRSQIKNLLQMEATATYIEGQQAAIDATLNASDANVGTDETV